VLSAFRPAPLRVIKLELRDEVAEMCLFCNFQKMLLVRKPDRAAEFFQGENTIMLRIGSLFELLQSSPHWGVHRVLDINQAPLVTSAGCVSPNVIIAALTACDTSARLSADPEAARIHTPAPFRLGIPAKAERVHGRNPNSIPG
jgi:hypothetical protein